MRKKACPGARGFGRLIVFVMMLGSLLVGRCAAGDGSITAGSAGQPKRLNLTVYFDYVEQTYSDWERLFENANTLLYRATNGNLIFGTVRFSRSRTVAKNADIVIHKGSGGAQASVEGMGYEGEVDLHQNSDRGSTLTLIHELGHYVFGLYDEYTGIKKVGSAGGSLVKKNPGDESPQIFDTSRVEAYYDYPLYCVSRTDVNTPLACIMDASTGTADSRRNFCLGENNPGQAHNSGILSGGFWFETEQHHWRGGSCWKRIAKVLGVTAPATAPDLRTDPPQKPVFKYDKEGAVALAVDVSAGAAGALSSTKAGAKAAIQVARSLGMAPDPTEAAQLALVSFGNGTATLDQPLTELNAPVKAGFTAKVHGWTALGDASIGAALRKALDAILADPSASDQSTRTIILVSSSPNQAGDPPGEILTELAVNHTRVVTVAVGDPANRELLSNIAMATGGEALVVDSPDELEELLPQLMVEEANGIEIAAIEGHLDTGNTTTTTIPVSAGASLVSFVLTSDDPDNPLTLTVVPPGGAPIDLMSPPSEAEVLFDHEVITINVKNPTPGDWGFVVSAVGNPGQNFWLEAFEQTGEVEIEAGPEEDNVTYPRAIRLAMVASVPEGDVTGLQVTANVTCPSGPPVSMTLADDGQRSVNGDLVAGDGEYSGYFTRFAGSGTYQFEVSVVNAGGTIATVKQGDTRGVPRPPTPVEPFRGKVETSAVLIGAPSGASTGLIPPAGLEVTGTSSTVTLTWRDSNPTATVFEVERSVDDGSSFVSLGMVPAGQNSFTDTAIATFLAAVYRVTAISPAGRSAPSDEAHADLAAIRATAASTAVASSGSGGCVRLADRAREGFDGTWVALVLMTLWTLVFRRIRAMHRP